MKKKQRCFVKRFAALVAALVLCVALSIPVFASNNASTQKWVVSDERQLKNEAGSYSRYLLLSPYVGGAKYAATFTTQGSSVPSTVASNTYDFWLAPLNYPDWWRSAIPLGNRAYFHISNLTVIKFSSSAGNSDLSLVYFVPLNKSYEFSSTASYGSSAASLTQSYPFYPYIAYHSASGYSAYKFNSLGAGIPVGSSTGTAYYSFQDCQQVIFSPFLLPTGSSTYDVPYAFGFSSENVFDNLSSNQQKRSKKKYTFPRQI